MKFVTPSHYSIASPEAPSINLLEISPGNSEVVLWRTELV